MHESHSLVNMNDYEQNKTKQKKKQLLLIGSNNNKSARNISTKENDELNDKAKYG